MQQIAERLEEQREQMETLRANNALALRGLPAGEGVCSCPTDEQHQGPCLGAHCDCHHA
jgi:hypothetical protein